MASAPFDAQARSAGDRYRALLAVSEAIVSHRDLSALFHELAGRLHQVVRFDYLALCLHEATSNTMRVHVLEGTEPTPLPSVAVLPVEEDPAGVGLADPASADLLECARGNALAAGPGTSEAVRSPEFLHSAAHYSPAAAGHARLRVQAAVRLRDGGCELPAARCQPGRCGCRERPGLPGDRGAEGRTLQSERLPGGGGPHRAQLRGDHRG